MTKKVSEKEQRLVASVNRNESSWRTGQLEVFEWVLVKIRKAYAAAPTPAAGEALAGIGTKIREERDRRFPKNQEKAEPDESDNKPHPER